MPEPAQAEASVVEGTPSFISSEEVCLFAGTVLDVNPFTMVHRRRRRRKRRDGGRGLPAPKGSLLDRRAFPPSREV